MNDSQKIEELLHHFRMEQKNFAEKCGFEPNNISKIKLGKCGISNRVANKILAAFPEVDKTWLMTGEGEMIKNSNYQSNNSGSFIGKVGNNSHISQNDISVMVEMLRNKDNIIQDILKRNEKLQERLFELQDKLLSILKTEK